MSTETRDDLATTAATAISAAILVDFGHEALGHGGLCLALGGRITLLTTSLFACEPSRWPIAAAGPVMSLCIGTLCLFLQRFVPETRPTLRLWLILVTAFSYFWEGGYLAKAMLFHNGDLYYTALYGVGDLGSGAWLGFALAGAVFYLLAIRVTNGALSATFGDVRRGRILSRAAWLAATLASIIVPLPSSHGWSNWRDTVLSLGVASLPLLLIPVRAGTGKAPSIPRSWPLIIIAILMFCAWTATMGHGLG